MSHVITDPEAPDRAGLPRHPATATPFRCCSTATTAPTWLIAPTTSMRSSSPRRVRCCVSGTHLSQPQTYARLPAARCALARAAGTRVVLDIDYRPVLWGLTSPGLGEQRYVASGEVSAHLQTVMPPCDLRGRHRGGDPHRRRQHRHARRAAPPARAHAGARSWSSAGRWAASSSPAPIPDEHRGRPHRARASRSRSSTSSAPATPSWRLPARLAARRAAANAAAPMPTPAARWSSRATAARRRCRAGPSCTHFLAHGSPTRRLRDDAQLEHLHRDTTRTRRLGRARRARLRPPRAVRGHGAARTAPAHDRIVAFKRLIAEGARGSGADATLRRRRRHRRRPLRRGHAVPADRQRAAGSRGRSSCRARGRWRSRPAPTLALHAARLARRARRQVPRLHSPGRSAGRCAQQQLERLRELQAACVATGHELLLEVIPPARHAERRRRPGARARADLRRRHRPGLVEAAARRRRGCWDAITQVIAATIRIAAACCCSAWKRARRTCSAASRGGALTRCKGFAVGRSIFADMARRGSPATCRTPR